VPLTATSDAPTAPIAAATAARPTLLADYATLFKLRVSTMVIVTSAAGFYLGCLRSGISPFSPQLIKALAGIAVVTCGASALNQALERRTDRLMRRTEDRPMATGRISLPHGLTVGFAAVFLGSLYLALATNPLTGTLTLLTAVGYVAIYTPLKRVTTVNTFIGAFPGALPPLIGWMYREDYARAGIRITPTLADPRYAARSTVIQALFYAALMLPVSLWPVALGVAGRAYAAAAIALTLGYLWYTVRFARIAFGPSLADDATTQPARDLLRASVIYLPLLLAAMMLGARGRLLF